MRTKNSLDNHKASVTYAHDPLQIQRGTQSMERLKRVGFGEVNED